MLVQPQTGQAGQSLPISHTRQIIAQHATERAELRIGARVEIEYRAGNVLMLEQPAPSPVHRVQRRQFWSGDV